MEKIDEWKEHYQKSSDSLMKAREAQRKRTSVLFDLFSHRLNSSTGGGVFTTQDEESKKMINEMSESLSGMIFHGLLSIAEAIHAFEISISENEDMYAAFDNNNFAFIYTYLKSLDDIVLTELKKIAKEITLIELLDHLSEDIAKSSLSDKEPKAFKSVVDLLKS